jgi:hypothetical protein
VEVVARTGATDPLQMGTMAVKVGVILELTVTVSVVVVAHCPASGVKVYVAVVVLSTEAGDQVPVIPLLEVVGRTGADEPLHIDGMVLNAGTIPPAVTVTVSVVVVAHCPALGVKVYVAVVVLSTVAGDHEPVIPLVEVVGRTGATDPLQIGAMAAKVGVILELTVTVSVVVVAHCPTVGVKV